MKEQPHPPSSRVKTPTHPIHDDSRQYSAIRQLARDVYLPVVVHAPHTRRVYRHGGRSFLAVRLARTPAVLSFSVVSWVRRFAIDALVASPALLAASA